MSRCARAPGSPAAAAMLARAVKHSFGPQPFAPQLRQERHRIDCTMVACVKSTLPWLGSRERRAASKASNTEAANGQFCAPALAAACAATCA